MMKNSRRPVMRLVTATAVAVPILLVSGCGNSLSGSSTCQEFLNSSTADQDQIVSSLAAKYRKQAYATLPAGSPKPSRPSWAPREHAAHRRRLRHLVGPGGEERNLPVQAKS
jgi:hypothetical protein